MGETRAVGGEAEGLVGVGYVVSRWGRRGGRLMERMR